jgi:hypothetical protein
MPVKLSGLFLRDLVGKIYVFFPDFGKFN